MSAARFRPASAQPQPKLDERPMALAQMVAGQKLDRGAVIEHCAKIFAKLEAEGYTLPSLAN